MGSVCDLQKLNEFVHNGVPNSKLIYYTGFSLTDTVLSNQVRKMMYKYAVEGKIYLVQQRMFPYYNFIAIKSGVPPVISLLPYSDEKLARKYTRVDHRKAADNGEARSSEIAA